MIEITRRRFLRGLGEMGVAAAGAALFPQTTVEAAWEGYRQAQKEARLALAAGHEAVFGRGPETYPLPPCGLTEVYNAAVFNDRLAFAGMDPATAADLKASVEEAGVSLMRVEAMTARVGKAGGDVSDFLSPAVEDLRDIVTARAEALAAQDQQVLEVRLRTATPLLVADSSGNQRWFAPWHLEGLVRLPSTDRRGVSYVTLAAGVNTAQEGGGEVQALTGPDWQRIGLLEGDPSVQPSPQQVETSWGQVVVAENRPLTHGSGMERQILVVFPPDSGKGPFPKWGDSFHESGSTKFSVTPSAAGATLSYWARRGEWRGVEVMDIKDPGGAEDAVGLPLRLPSFDAMLDYLAKEQVMGQLVVASSQVPTAVGPLDDKFYRVYFPAQDGQRRATICSMVLKANRSEDRLVIPRGDEIEGDVGNVFDLPGEIDADSLKDMAVRVKRDREKEEVVFFSATVGEVSRAFWALTADNGQVYRLTDPQKTNLVNVRVGAGDVQVLLEPRENYRRDNQPFVWAWPLA
jgi:hypothetical protein